MSTLGSLGSVGVWRAVAEASLDPQRPPAAESRASAPRRSFADHLRPRAAHAESPAAKAPDGFVQRVASMAARLHVRPGDLMAVMRFESGLRPDAINPATHAVGLIQFLPHVAADLLGLPPGTPDRDRRAVEAFAAMTADEQLDYVERYLERVLAGRGAGSLRDTYMAVLYPAAVGRGDGYVIARRAGESAFERAVYRQNAPLDIDADGAITAGEAAARVAGQGQAPRPAG